MDYLKSYLSCDQFPWGQDYIYFYFRRSGHEYLLSATQLAILHKDPSTQELAIQIGNLPAKDIYKEQALPYYPRIDDLTSPNWNNFIKDFLDLLL